MPALDLRSDAPAADEPAAPSRRRRDPRAVLAVGATAITMVPALLVIVRFAFRGDVLLTGDFAAIDARVRDVWNGPLPLVGPYSNGWSHPGPLYFYVLAPLSRLFRDPWTVVVGAALLHALAVGLTARLAWRRGGLSLTLLALATLAFATYGSSARLLLDPWNPHVAMPFFVLFVLQVWSVMLHDRWQLVGAAIVGTFLVQAHLGYAPLVGAAAVVALVAVLVDVGRRRTAARDWTRPVLVSVAVSLVLWLAPIWEQLTHDPGNVTSIYRYFRDSPEGQLGLRTGTRVFAGMFAPVPGWLGGGDRENLLFLPRQASVLWLVVPAAALVAALVVAVRRHLPDVARLVVLTGVVTVVGVLALARLKAGAWTYMSLWRIPLAILVLAVLVWTLWRAWSPRPDAARTVGVAALGVAILGGVVPMTADLLDHPHVASLHDDSAAVLAQVRASGAIDRVAEPVLVEANERELRGVTEMLVDQLDLAGVDVRVPPARGLVWGTDRVGRRADVATVWLVSESGVGGARLRDLPGARVVARTTPLSAADERTLTRLQRTVADQLDAAGRADLIPALDRPDLTRALADQVPGLDPDALERIARYDERVDASRRCRCSVVAFDAGRAPRAQTSP